MFKLVQTCPNLFKLVFSDNGSQDHPTSSSAASQNNSNNADYVPLSPLSLLAEEAARRTPTLNLAPCTTLDVPLDPKFIGGPIIAGSKYYRKKPVRLACVSISLFYPWDFGLQSIQHSPKRIISNF